MSENEEKFQVGTSENETLLVDDSLIFEALDNGVVKVLKSGTYIVNAEIIFS